MQTVRLNTGQTLPVVGYGTWKIRLAGTAKRNVLEALQAGYRLIDTAKIYGNERAVGEAINASGIPRSEIQVTTKLWNSDHGYRETFKAFNASLKRLGLDYIDLYLIHWPVTNKRQDSWRALQEIYLSGRTKAIGVSNYTIRHLEELLAHTTIVPAVNQVEFHPFIYRDQEPLLKFCRQKGIVLEAYSPLAHGKRMHNPVITKIAERLDRSNVQVILRWCIQRGTIPLPKSTEIRHIKQNIDLFDFNLSAENMSSIDNLSDGTRTCWDPSQIT